MTVAELIAILAKMPQDATVLVADWQEQYRGTTKRRYRRRLRS